MSGEIASRSQNSTGEKVIATSSESPSSASNETAPKWVDTMLFWIDWGIKVLGVAAAVVFGIWAPLSYQATKSSNLSSDTVQSSVISVAIAANSQASSALSVQSVALDAMNSRIGAIGQLWLLDFCIANTELAACESFTSKIPITSLVSYLASQTGVQASTSIATSTSSSLSSANPTKSSLPSTTLSLPVILGIVFAVISLLGIISGIFVSRLKWSKSRRHEEE